MTRAGLALAVLLPLLASCGRDAPDAAGTVADASTVSTIPPYGTAAAATTERFRTLVQPGDPGCSVAVGHRGEVVYAEGFGTADLGTGAPITADTSFDIGSTSKQFTGLAVLLAARQGDLDLGDDIRRWVPELPDYGRPPVRLGQMLHHESGLPDYVDLLLDAGFDYTDRTTVQDALDVLASRPRLDFVPGTSWAYSNSGYFLLAVALERATGLGLPDYLAANVFGPLDLAMVMDLVTPIDGEAISYERADGGWVVGDSPWEQVGDGAVQTTASELVVWADSWTTAPFGEDVLAAQLDGVPNGEGGRYGAGIDIYPDHLEHAGAWGGFTTEFLVDPEQRVAVAVTCNRPDLPDAGPGLLALWTRTLS